MSKEEFDRFFAELFKPYEFMTTCRKNKRIIFPKPSGDICCNSGNLLISSTQGLFVIIHKTKAAIISLNNIKWLIFIMRIIFVFCGVGARLLSAV